MYVIKWNSENLFDMRYKDSGMWNICIHECGQKIWIYIENYQIMMVYCLAVTLISKITRILFPLGDISR